MKIDVLLESLLQGEHFHCKPVKREPMVEAQIISFELEDDSIFPAFKKMIVCSQRRSKSYCGLRDRPGFPGPRRCLWYRGDSGGLYQIIGPGMDKKSDRGYK